MRQLDINDPRKSDFADTDHLTNRGAQIILYRDLDLIGQYHFSGNKVTIGKGKEADLILEDSRLSEIQAIIHLQNDNIIISDQSDRLGVYLNGKPVKAAVLEPNDLIEIGEYGLKIRIARIRPKNGRDNDFLKAHKTKSTIQRKNSDPKNKTFDSERLEKPCNQTSSDLSERSLPKAIMDSNRISLKVPKNTGYPEEYLSISRPINDESALPSINNNNTNNKVFTSMQEEYSKGQFKSSFHKDGGQSESSTSSPKQSMKETSPSSTDEESAENFFTLPPYKKNVQPESFSTKKKLSQRETSPLPEADEYSENFFTLPPYRRSVQTKSSTADTAERKKNPKEPPPLPEVDEYSENFFTLPPYKKSVPIKPLSVKGKPCLTELPPLLKDEKYPDNFFTLPPYKDDFETKSPFTESKPSIKKTAPLLKDEDYPEDFFTLPPYKTQKEPLSESRISRIFSGGLSDKDPSKKEDGRATISNVDTSLPTGDQRYNLVFSGKLKPGWTLIKVKSSLNRRFGFDYRRLGQLVLNRKMVLKRNLTHKAAAKLGLAFDASGAICSIVPSADQTGNLDRRQKSMQPGKMKHEFSEAKGSGEKSEKTTSRIQTLSSSLSDLVDSLEISTKRSKPKQIAAASKDVKSDVKAAEFVSEKKFSLSLKDVPEPHIESRDSQRADEFESSDKFSDTLTMMADGLFKDQIPIEERSPSPPPQKSGWETNKFKRPLQLIKNTLIPSQNRRQEKKNI